MKKIAIVLPCFNEEDVIQQSYSELRLLLTRSISKNRIREDSFILFVDDGSTDSTPSLLNKMGEMSDGHFRFLRLNQNVGQEKALWLGMKAVVEEVDWVVTMDVDLQDDIYQLPFLFDMMDKERDVIFGVRHNRDVDTFMKKTTASMYYFILRLMNIPSIENHANYRAVSSAFMRGIPPIEGDFLFLRMLFPYFTSKHPVFYYTRSERIAGKTKYSYIKMIQLAWKGVLFGWRLKRHI